MKTAGRENPNRRATWPCNRALGAGGQNRSCSIQWAAKQEKFQPKEMCFFLTSTFIELIGTYVAGGGCTTHKPTTLSADWLNIPGQSTNILPAGTGGDYDFCGKECVGHR